MMKKKLSLTVALALSAMSYSSCFAAEAEAEKLNEYAVEDIVVTAERIPTEKMNTPANVAVVTAEDIEDNHYQTVGEAVEAINGVTITRMGSGAEEIIRLNGNDRVVLMIDGIRMNNAQGFSSGRASVNVNMLPSVSMIDRIEVIKGGGSALYGSDAVGGVVNIITKKGDKLKTSIDLSTGSGHATKAEITNSGSQNNTDWFVTAGIEHRSFFRYKAVGQTNTMANSDKEVNDIDIRIGQKLSEHESLKFNYMHKTNKYGQYKCTGTASTPVVTMNDNKMSEIYNNFSLAYNFKEGSAAPGFLRYFNNYRNKVYYSQMDTRTQGIDYQNGWQLNKDNILIAGVEWHRNEASSTGSGYSNKENTNTAFYIQDTWTISNKWNLIPGVRFDHHSDYGNHWTPKVAVNYRAGKRTQFYGNWGKVFKAPTTDDLYYFEDWGFGMGMFGNDKLNPETGWSATIGMNHQLNDDMDIGLSFFKTSIKNKIAWPQPTPGRYVATNLDYEQQQGMELSFKHRLSPMWSYDLGYTYTQRKTSSSGSANILDSTNEQPNGYRLGIHYRSGAWKANLEGIIASGLNETRYVNGSYSVWNINCTYDINKNLSTYFKLNNIFNQEHYDYPLNYGNYTPANGRNFMLGLTYSF